MLELAITENLQREDLHPLDEAMAFGRMQTELGYSYAQIAERLGKSKGYVQNRMRLLQLEEDLQQLVAERPDTLAHVYEIARVPDPQDRSALIAAVRDDVLSRAATRARVQALLQPEDTPPTSSDKSYFQKYDSEPDQEERPGTPTAQTEESYFQKYDREVGNKDRPAPTPSSGSSDSVHHRGNTPDESARLTSTERSTLTVVQTKVERLLDDPTMLTPEDWAVLSTLAVRLSDLLRKVG
jgi:ParB-like chromosome segregation protein Spo0J